MNQWIKCSERMPDGNDPVYAKYKTFPEILTTADRINEGVARFLSDYVENTVWREAK